MAAETINEGILRALKWLIMYIEDSPDKFSHAETLRLAKWAVVAQIAKVTNERTSNESTNQ